MSEEKQIKASETPVDESGNKIGFSNDNKFYVETKDKLDNVGCGMCLAKWTQVTLHLQLGHTHSCHHPKTHKISKKERPDAVADPENFGGRGYFHRCRQVLPMGCKIGFQVLTVFRGFGDRVSSMIINSFKKPKFRYNKFKNFRY